MDQKEIWLNLVSLMSVAIRAYQDSDNLHALPTVHDAHAHVAIPVAAMQ